jgi:hypothetical protein
MVLTAIALLLPLVGTLRYRPPADEPPDIGAQRGT